MLLKCHIGFRGEAHSSSCRQTEGQEGPCCCKRDDDVDFRRLLQTMCFAHWSVCPSQVTPMTWGSVDLDDSVHHRFFWYRPTWVVPDKRPLNGCVCVCVCVNWLQLRRDELLVCAYRRMTRKRADCRSSCRSLTAARATFPSLRRASSTSSLTTCTRLGLVSRILVYKQQQLLVVYTTTPV